MKQYLDMLDLVLTKGAPKNDRTNTGTFSIFGHQARYNLADGFPLLTTKSVHFHSVLTELLWFLRGDTNIAYLREHKVKIWDEWADENGDLGPIYGHQWRSWSIYKQEYMGPFGPTFYTKIGVIDQMANVVREIKTNPNSRRLIVSAWNVTDIQNMALPPCHVLFQFWVGNGALSCQLCQRSADIFLGVPFNIASYALLTMMVAQVCDLRPGELIHTFGDLHLYSNHIEQAKLQLSREPRPLPKVELNPDITDLFAFTHKDVTLVGYDPHPAIKAQVAV